MIAQKVDSMPWLRLGLTLALVIGGVAVGYGVLNASVEHNHEKIDSIEADLKIYIEKVNGLDKKLAVIESDVTYIRRTLERMEASK